MEWAAQAAECWPGGCALSIPCSVAIRGRRLRCGKLCGMPPAAGSERSRLRAKSARPFLDVRPHRRRHYVPTRFFPTDIGPCRFLDDSAEHRETGIRLPEIFPAPAKHIQDYFWFPDRRVSTPAAPETPGWLLPVSAIGCRPRLQDSAHAANLAVLLRPDRLRRLPANSLRRSAKVAQPTIKCRGEVRFGQVRSRRR